MVGQCQPMSDNVNHCRYINPCRHMTHSRYITENLILIVPKLSSFSFVMLFLISKNVLAEFLRGFKFPINGIIPFEIRVKLLPFYR
jgi:hypothetical protein